MSRCSFSEINFVTRYNPDPLNATNVTMYNFISVNSFKISFLFFFFFLLLPFEKYSNIRKIEIKLHKNRQKRIPIYIYIFFSKNNSVYSSNFIGIRTCANTSNGRNRNVQDCWQFTAATIIDAYPIRYVIGPSIERPTSNFCTRSRDTIGIDDPAHRSDQPPVLFFFLLSFFFFPRCFDFVMRCFRSIPTGIFCVFAVGFIFESELNKFRKGFLPKEGGKRSICIDCGTFHRIKAYIFAGKNCQIASTRCNCAIMFLTRFSF